MASLRLWKKVATPLSSGWKMACTTVAAPFSSGVESSGPIKAEKVGKRKVFQNLKSLTVETIDLILREEEKKGVSVTQTDLVRWAKRLAKNKDKSENALEIFRWMDKKKMVFSPSELAVYVDLIAEVKGFPAAHAYFRKVDPTFKEWEPNPKNWPAHMKLVDRLIDIEDKSSLKNLVFICSDPDDSIETKTFPPTTPAQKRMILSKLKSSETPCDDVLREMEKQRFRITRADLIRWAELLEKQGQSEKYLEIHRFMMWKGVVIRNYKYFARNALWYRKLRQMR